MSSGATEDTAHISVATKVLQLASAQLTQLSLSHSLTASLISLYTACTLVSCDVEQLVGSTCCLRRVYFGQQTERGPNITGQLIYYKITTTGYLYKALVLLLCRFAWSFFFLV